MSTDPRHASPCRLAPPVNPLRPLSPYAVSKVTQDLMGFQYWKSYGLDIVRTRAFNHTGPRRGDAFATSSFAKQIAEAEAGLREPVIQVGDLKPTRDDPTAVGTSQFADAVIEEMNG